MHLYRIYDFLIESEVELYNLPETEGEPEIFIRYGEIDYTDVPENRKEFFCSEDLVVFGTDYCAYRIEKGTTVTVCPRENATLHDVTSFLIGWGFAFLFTQRGFSCLHSTTLDIDGRGLIISGVSGAGKSTTALELMKKGYKFLADDMTIINPGVSDMIRPCNALQKVCRDVAETLDPAKLLYINEKRDKFAYINEEEFCTEQRPLNTLVLLRVDDIEEIKVEQMQGLDMYLRTLETLYLAEIYSFKGTPEGDKLRCLQAAGKMKIFRITRPRGKNSVGEIADIIVDLVKKD